jgi:hypothetical protein
MCGDGIVEGDEICDDGFEGNQPENMCTPGCIPAKCGDAYVQPSNGETCDDGAFNAAMPGYGQCSTSCVRESFCGDGVVQIEAGEECEPGGGGDGENCGAMCKLSPRLVFVRGGGGVRRPWGHAVPQDDPGDTRCHKCVRDRLVFVTSKNVHGDFAERELAGYDYMCNHLAAVAGC